MPSNKNIVQLIWGVLLALMGITLIARSPQIMERIEQIEYYTPISWLIRVMIYFIALILIGGGSKKIWTNTRKGNNS
jgi:hypothetical protein